MEKKEEQEDFKFAKITLYFIIGLVIILIIVGFVKLSFNKKISKETIKKIDENIVLVQYVYGGKSMEGIYVESISSGSGVLYYGDDNEYHILTNRQIVDCGYWDVGDKCWEKLWEKAIVITRDGKTHNVTSIGYSPYELNLAQLVIKRQEGEEYSTIKEIEKPSLNQHVLAAGYPEYSDDTTKLSINKGQITGFKEHITKDNFSYQGIESDAYKNFKSTGGGLFDEKGNLLGITIWSNEYSAYAINYHNIITFLDGFSYCEEGYYFKSGNCIEKCYENQIRSIIDGLCYREVKTTCENQNYYCDEGQYCFNNQCISCPKNTYLFEDGLCYYKSAKETLYREATYHKINDT
ncbi:MAG: hypothetical protein BWY36_00558 [Candidatus Diapherotrites archaeon ADurb.Bin253]|jgi:hypothetical protein|nr:MAG: hypothetical protein BWY36_00558 [Candidatus Diapherotrites archaeon ADurb.Bin253]HNZ51834.1 serine protease [Candidatus Pacearchaeota archaeon]HOH04192.1 serine protease [Candidatus Pacearchaeota archaeon]HPX74796.1 serine protease [Candidatus Pacearchaeota archaeon]HQC61247.1 serine protease [Candidatus Pacearchaeota archaeon]